MSEIQTNNKAAAPEERKFEEKDYYGWRCPDSWAQAYLAHCQRAVDDPKHFAHFRSASEYGSILEHVSCNLGSIYLENVYTNNTFLINQIEKFSLNNDQIGSPKVCEYQLEHSSKKFQVSPTTLRYIKVLSDLITLFGSLKNLNIVEIGGGYGGLASVIKTQFSYKMYYDVDLAPAGALAKKYTTAVGINNFISISPEQIGSLDDVDIDLVISNYAFSECNRETREEYINKILSRAKMGYITHNGTDERRNETKSFIEGYKNFRVFDRDPADKPEKRHPVFVWDSRSTKGEEDGE